MEKTRDSDNLPRLLFLHAVVLSLILINLLLLRPVGPSSLFRLLPAFDAFTRPRTSFPRLLLLLSFLHSSAPLLVC